MFSYDLIADVYPRAFAASRGIQLADYGRTPKLPSSPPETRHLIPAQNSYHHEVHSPQYSDGSRLSYSSTQHPHFAPQEEDLTTAASLEEPQAQWLSVEDIAAAPHSNLPSTPCGLRRSVRSGSSRHNTNYANTSNFRPRHSIRNSSRKRDSRAKKTSSSSWHMKAADEFLKEAQARDINTQDVVNCATSLIQERIYAIKQEELVLDWSDSAEAIPLEYKDTKVRTSSFYYSFYCYLISRYSRITLHCKQCNIFSRNMNYNLL